VIPLERDDGASVSLSCSSGRPSCGSPADAVVIESRATRVGNGLEVVRLMSPWAYPENRYYYEWYDEEPSDERSDMEIKQDLLDRIRSGPYAEQYDIDVDVKKGVVILTGTAATTVAKRVAGDDAWDTRGVTDVSNQIQVRSTIPVT
jgi:hypothetical protein